MIPVGGKKECVRWNGKDSWTQWEGLLRLNIDRRLAQVHRICSEYVEAEMFMSGVDLYDANLTDSRGHYIFLLYLDTTKYYPTGLLHKQCYIGQGGPRRVVDGGRGSSCSQC